MTHAAQILGKREGEEEEVPQVITVKTFQNYDAPNYRSRMHVYA